MVHELSSANGKAHHTDAECRICGQIGLNSILSLGHTPLANALLREDQLNQAESCWPLELAWCPDCSLAQITETVPPEILFREYAYFSSFSDTMVAHARTIADRIRTERKLGPQSLAVEIASNDGYLLQWYHKAGVPVLGIEPAQNIARVAQAERGVRTISEFFGRQIAEDLVRSGHRADVIHANNVLAHVADLNGVVAGFATLLKPDGIVVVEAPYLKDLIDHVEFDTIYHEHLCYFSLTALARLFQQHGLTIVNVERLAIHGGSLRIFAAHSASAQVQPSVTKLLQEEAAWVRNNDIYGQFGARVESLRQSLTGLLTDLKSQGKSIAVYGASAKGSTLLNYFGIGADVLDYVVDRSTIKQGLYTPGTRLKICDPARLVEDQPDYCLLLTWNFADEILKQQSAYRQQGGKFIIPIPEVRVA
ncbi:class I SAM-dependent methyltransferase [Schlesneria sp. T3-172]|uniref:class I SAM-dependent methyltransferase n=1 Tax=Schlesneria sphaerica TaxID=3373610 RepID=UPI0037CBEA18